MARWAKWRSEPRIVIDLWRWVWEVPMERVQHRNWTGKWGCCFCKAVPGAEAWPLVYTLWTLRPAIVTIKLSQEVRLWPVQRQLDVQTGFTPWYGWWWKFRGTRYYLETGWASSWIRRSEARTSPANLTCRTYFNKTRDEFFRNPLMMVNVCLQSVFIG